MALPHEDGPSRSPGGFAGIEADVTRMEEFAALLAAEVERSYSPQLASAFDDLVSELPSPYADFAELLTFAQELTSATQDTADTVYFYREATGGFAWAAGEVSRSYRGADAWSSARLGEMEAALDKTAAAAPPSHSRPEDPAGRGDAR